MVDHLLVSSHNHPNISAVLPIIDHHKPTIWRDGNHRAICSYQKNMISAHFWLEKRTTSILDLCGDFSCTTLSNDSRFCYQHQPPMACTFPKHQAPVATVVAPPSLSAHTYWSTQPKAREVFHLANKENQVTITQGDIGENHQQSQDLLSLMDGQWLYK